MAINKPSTGLSIHKPLISDWLKDGDTLELTWIAQVDDSFGPQGAEQLTITIGGTNDLPTIDASTDPVPLDEVLGDSSAQDIPPTTGTITFTDQDLGDDISSPSPVTPPPLTTAARFPSTRPLISHNSSMPPPSPSQTADSSPMAINKPSTGLSIHKPLISIG